MEVGSWSCQETRTARSEPLPSSKVDSLGGDLAFAVGLSAFAPVPYKPTWPLKLHAFLNTGKVVGWNTGEYTPVRRYRVRLKPFVDDRPNIPGKHWQHVPLA